MQADKNKIARNGFSLIELLTVLLLLAIIAAVSMPATGRFLGTIAEKRKERDILAVLRYARLTAISKGQYVDVRTADDGTAFRLTGAIDETRSFSLGEGQTISQEPELITFYPEGIASIGTITYHRDGKEVHFVIDPLTALPLPPPEPD